MSKRMSRNAFLAFGLAAALAAPLCVHADEQPRMGVESTQVRGVYWPWEFTTARAEKAGVELWAFVDLMMGRIKNDWHCNTIWFVNGPTDPVKTCQLAEKHGLTVLIGTELVHGIVHGFESMEQARGAVAKTVAELGGQKALGGYVLKDEPRGVEAMQMEAYRGMLHQADPTRPSVVVSMTGDTEVYVRSTRLPIICTDIYHFGGDGSPYIPNNAERSQGTFRAAVEALNSMTDAAGKAAWCMPQAFTELWGPHWADKNGNAVLEPGCYWHWRTPTPAEVTWQTWESIRAGCKGVVFFSAFMGTGSEWTPEKGEMPEDFKNRIEANKSSKAPVVKERFNTGEAFSLSYADGTSTPQAVAMGKAYANLSKLQSVTPRLRAAELPAIFADGPAAVNTFTDPNSPGKRYAVVVNDDLKEAKEIDLFFPPTVAAVEDVTRSAAFSLSAYTIGDDGLQTAKIRLEPGDGAFLAISFKKDSPGMIVFQERFDNTACPLELRNCKRQFEARGFGMGRQWLVRKDGGAEQESWIELKGLNDRQHAHASPLGTNLSAIGAKEAVFMKVDGVCPQAEDILVQFVDKDGNAGWNKTSNFHLPFRIPPDTSAIRIRLSNNAAVKWISLWRSASAE